MYDGRRLGYSILLFYFFTESKKRRSQHNSQNWNTPKEGRMVCFGAEFLMGSKVPREMITGFFSGTLGWGSESGG